MDRQSSNLEHECKQLVSGFRTLILATSGEDGEPDASTVPYLLNSGGFAILVSELARHTSHLLGTGRCTVLFVEDEREAANIFARRRLTIRCRVSRVEAAERRAELLLDRMAVEFGPVISMLRQLPDFHLLQLEPVNCNYVRGFGQAYRFEPADYPGVWQDSSSAAAGSAGGRVVS